MVFGRIYTSKAVKGLTYTFLKLIKKYMHQNYAINIGKVIKVNFKNVY